MKYNLIHLDTGVLASSDKMWVLEDLKKYYLSLNVKSHLLVITKGDSK
jgi:hypothetical protein